MEFTKRQTIPFRNLQTQVAVFQWVQKYKFKQQFRKDTSMCSLAFVVFTLCVAVLPFEVLCEDQGECTYNSLKYDFLMFAKQLNDSNNWTWSFIHMILTLKELYLHNSWKNNNDENIANFCHVDLLLNISDIHFFGHHYWVCSCLNYILPRMNLHDLAR